jgi:hypothetical protein
MPAITQLPNPERDVRGSSPKPARGGAQRRGLTRVRVARQSHGVMPDARPRRACASCRAANPGAHRTTARHFTGAVRAGRSGHQSGHALAMLLAHRFRAAPAQIPHGSRTDPARISHESCTRIRGQPLPHQTPTWRA